MPSCESAGTQGGRGTQRTAGSVTRTLRLDPELDAFFAASAERERVSASFLVNQALRKFVEWDVFADKFGVVSLPSSFLDRAMELLSDEEAKELGAWVGTEHLPEFLAFWFKEVTPRTVVRGYPRLAAKYGRAFEYEEYEKEGQWTIILKHGGGRKWSLYYGELLRALFKQALKADAALDETEHQVVARFRLP